MSGHHPYLLSHHAEKLENVFIENFLSQEVSLKGHSLTGVRLSGDSPDLERRLSGEIGEARTILPQIFLVELSEVRLITPEKRKGISFLSFFVFS